MDKRYTKQKKEDKQKKNPKKRNTNSKKICKIHEGHKWKACKLNLQSFNFDAAAYA